MIDPKISKTECSQCESENCPIRRWLRYKRPETNEERFQLAKLMIESGLSVVPVTFGKKFPDIKWKEYQNRIATEDELKNWFLLSQHTIGIVTGKISNLIVIDLDSKEAIEWALKNLPPTPIRVKTSRGEHWYYRHPGPQYLIKNGTKIEIDGKIFDVDVRGDGGFVMGLGAVHPSGCHYELI